MRKIFFFDIDNTLLDHRSGRIPQSAINAIAQLKQAGHTVAIATGRSYGHALPYIELLQPAYSITQNGARIYRGQDEVQQTPLNKVGLHQLFADLDAQGLVYGAIGGESGNQGRVSADTELVRAPLASVNIPYHINRDFHHHEAVFQAWVFVDESRGSTLIPELIANYPYFDYVRWHSHAVDITPGGINKLTGCSWVLNDTGIAAEHSIAFGDGLNDLEMLQGVGTGVAMGNAHPSLIEKADRVAPAVHQDGVARMVATLLDEFA